MKKTGVAAFGEILVDMLPEQSPKPGLMFFSANAGGAPANVAVAVARLGVPSAFIGKTGRDAFGEYLRKILADNGVDVTGLVSDPWAPTTEALVSLTAAGERRFSFYRTGCADALFRSDELNTAVIADSKIFHFGSLSLTDEPSYFSTEIAVKTAKDCGCTVTYDPNYRPPLWDSPEKAAERMAVLLPYVDIIKLSVEELEMISEGRGTEFLFEKGVRLALVTDGDKGATLCFKGEKAHIPAIKAKTVDTTGAGDIFLGTFVSEFIKKGENLDELSFDDAINFTQKAVFISGKSTEKYGAIASISDVII